MPPSLTGTAEAYVFGLSVRECFRARVRPSTRMQRDIFQASGWNFTKPWLMMSLVEATDKLIRFWKSRPEGSKWRPRQGQIFGWVIASGGCIHVVAWASKYHLVDNYFNLNTGRIPGGFHRLPEDGQKWGEKQFCINYLPSEDKTTKNSKDKKPYNCNVEMQELVSGKPRSLQLF